MSSHLNECRPIFLHYSSDVLNQSHCLSSVGRRRQRLDPCYCVAVHVNDDGGGGGAGAGGDCADR